MSVPASSRREFLLRLSSVSAVLAAGGVLSGCGGGGGNGGNGGGDGIGLGDDAMVRFDFGVASGDPLADRVILWTHARFADSEADVPLRFEVARSDAQYAIHLGDYLYEFGVDGFASQHAAELGRVSDPPTELLTLADYRRRYAQYRTNGCRCYADHTRADGSKV